MRLLRGIITATVLLGITNPCMAQRVVVQAIQRAPSIPAEQLRDWLRNPNETPERLGLYSLLLAYCGEPKDADRIALILEQVPKRKNPDGPANMITAMLILKPETYGPKMRNLARYKEEEFLRRYAVLLAVRHLHYHRPDIHEKLGSLRYPVAFLEIPDIADLAIDDLRVRKRWEHMDRILALAGKDGYKSLVAQNSILRFAVKGPGTAAAAYVAEMRKRDAEWVQEFEDYLKDRD